MGQIVVVFKTIFMDPTYLQLDDGYLEDKYCHKDLGEDANVIDIGEFIAMDVNVPNIA